MVSVRPTRLEEEASLPGDDVVPHADVVMDRAFTLPGDPASVWPWFVQLGKGRAGWYLPANVERLVPPSRRGARRVEDRWQHLAVGDVERDWGGKDATFETLALEPPHTIVYGSQRGHVPLTWVIHLAATGPADVPATRVHLRLRMGGVRHPRAAALGGGFFDWLTVLGLARGLTERLS
jgi:hypothetical protein